MVRLWRLYAPGMSLGFLPDEGGVLDQSAMMLDAFAVMSRAQAELEKQYPKKDGR